MTSPQGAGHRIPFESNAEGNSEVTPCVLADMATPTDPLDANVSHRESDASWVNAPLPSAHALATHRDATLPASRNADWRADLPAARAFVSGTIGVGAFASGLLEYMGGQIVRRAAANNEVFPLSEWAIGLVRNFAGAVGVGLAVALLALVLTRFKKRPPRVASAGFAFGVGGFLMFLFFLVSMAP